MYKLEKVDLNSNREKIEEIIEMLMCEVKKSNNDLYKHIKIEMYELEHGKKISEEMAHEWVKSMEPVGLHWTMEETTQAMRNLNYNCDPLDFFVVANMQYNDLYDIVKEDEELALKIAYRWLEDSDAKNNKLYCYWKYIIKRD